MVSLLQVKVDTAKKFDHAGKSEENQSAPTFKKKVATNDPRMVTVRTNNDNSRQCFILLYKAPMPGSPSARGAQSGGGSTTSTIWWSARERASMY